MYLQVATLVVILHYVDSSLPFCYRQHPSDEKRICITPNISACHTWINNQYNGLSKGSVTGNSNSAYSDTVSIFLLNYYMKNDWRAYWKSATVYTFSNAIRHEPLSYLTVFLFTVQFATFLKHFYRLYVKTWRKW
ncbi:hypothetical protein COOONC_21708 [Cooperia oncophora]